MPLQALREPCVKCTFINNERHDSSRGDTGCRIPEHDRAPRRPHTGGTPAGPRPGPDVPGHPAGPAGGWRSPGGPADGAPAPAGPRSSPVPRPGGRDTAPRRHPLSGDPYPGRLGDPPYPRPPWRGHRPQAGRPVSAATRAPGPPAATTRTARRDRDHAEQSDTHPRAVTGEARRTGRGTSRRTTERLLLAIAHRGLPSRAAPDRPPPSGRRRRPVYADPATRSHECAAGPTGTAERTTAPAGTGRRTEEMEGAGTPGRIDRRPPDVAHAGRPPPGPAGPEPGEWEPVQGMREAPGHRRVAAPAE